MEDFTNKVEFVRECKNVVVFRASLVATMKTKNDIETCTHILLYPNA